MFTASVFLVCVVPFWIKKKKKPHVTFDSDSIQLMQSCLMYQVNNDDDHNMKPYIAITFFKTSTNGYVHYEFLQTLLFHLVDRVTDRRLMECTSLSLSCSDRELSLGNITGKELLLPL